MKFNKMMCLLAMIYSSQLYADISKAHDNHEHNEHKDNSGNKDNEHSDDKSHDEHAEHTDNDNHEKHDDHDKHEEESSPNVGKDKAATFADEKMGIQLSEGATKNLELRTSRIHLENGFFNVPINSLVFDKDKAGIYRKRDSTYKLIYVEVKKVSGQVLITPLLANEISDGEKIVINGSGLLRIAELQAFGASGHGHGH